MKNKVRIEPSAKQDYLLYHLKGKILEDNNKVTLVDYSMLPRAVVQAIDMELKNTGKKRPKTWIIFLRKYPLQNILLWKNVGPPEVDDVLNACRTQIIKHIEDRGGDIE